MIKYIKKNNIFYKDVIGYLVDYNKRNIFIRPTDDNFIVYYQNLLFNVGHNFHSLKGNKSPGSVTQNFINDNDQEIEETLNSLGYFLIKDFLNEISLVMNKVNFSYSKYGNDFYISVPIMDEQCKKNCVNITNKFF